MSRGGWIPPPPPPGLIRVKRRELSENYYKAVKWVNNADAVLITLSMGLGAAGVGLLSTIIAAPTVVVLESLALCTKSSEA